MLNKEYSIIKFNSDPQEFETEEQFYDYCNKHKINTEQLEDGINIIDNKSAIYILNPLWYYKLSKPRWNTYNLKRWYKYEVRGITFFVYKSKRRIEIRYVYIDNHCNMISKKLRFRKHKLKCENIRFSVNGKRFYYDNIIKNALKDV